MSNCHFSSLFLSSFHRILQPTNRTHFRELFYFAKQNSAFLLTFLHKNPSLFADALMLDRIWLSPGVGGWG
jgi:hypothetical protein